MSDAPSIRIRADGPYVLTGLAVRGENGADRPIAQKEGKKPAAVLCRCGRSAQQPFCDGTHRSGFDGTETAPVDEPSLTTDEMVDDGPAAVGVLADGPLIVLRSVPLLLSDGRRTEARAGTKLCRCGKSADKPYCDGTHAGIGWQSA